MTSIVNRHLVSTCERGSSQHRALFIALKTLPREVAVGLTIGLTLFSASLAGGVIVATPLGADQFALGAAAAVSGAVFGGACAALLATSSFIMWGPIPTIALVQASLVAMLVADPALVHDPAVILTALFVCVALAAVLQIAVALAHLGSIVKYVPHPVVAGFINGVSATIFVSQMKLFFPFQHWGLADGSLVVHPAMLALVLTLVGFVLWLDSQSKKVPAPIVALLVGIVAYYVLRFAAPSLDLGATLGRLPISIPPSPQSQTLRCPKRGRS